LLALFPSLNAAAASVLTLIAPSLMPRCLELLDGITLQALRDAGNPIDPRAGAMLLIEVDGPEKVAEEHAQRVGNECERAGAFEVQVAANPAQRDRLWAARREMSYAVRKLSRHKLAHDIVVPRTQIGALLDHTTQSSESEAIKILTYGHAGDGALHINFLWDTDDQLANVGRAEAALFAKVVELGGTLTAEHGIGVMKSKYLALEQSSTLIQLQTGLKKVFDPKGLLNPGKIFPSGHTAC
jgi:glycolate oxidase